jgi:hypothetical protein
MDKILEELAYDEQIIKLSEHYFPYEKFDIDGKYSEEIIDDMLSLLINIAEDNYREAENMYFFLTNEKITIDEDEIYSEEEINYG